MKIAMKHTVVHAACLLVSLFMFTTLIAQTEEMAPEMSVAINTGDLAKEAWSPCPNPLDFEGCHISVLHGDPGKGNADILFRMQPGTAAKEHWHTSAERMLLISGEMHVTYEGEETQVLKAGSYAYGPAKKSHYAECVGKKPCVLFIAFEGPIDVHAD